MSDIQKIRKQMGLSQSQFANKFNIKLKTLQHWELNHEAPEHIVTMAKHILELEEQLRDENSK